MVNRRKSWRHKEGFLAMDSDGIAEYVTASNRGRKWKGWEDALIISSEEDDETDAALASQLGRTPAAVRGRRNRLKEMGKL